MTADQLLSVNRTARGGVGENLLAFFIHEEGINNPFTDWIDGQLRYAHKIFTTVNQTENIERIIDAFFMFGQAFLKSGWSNSY